MIVRTGFVVLVSLQQSLVFSEVMIKKASLRVRLGQSYKSCVSTVVKLHVI